MYATVQYQFETTCIDSKAQWIWDMVDDAVDITYETMRKRVVGLDEWAKYMGYELHASRGLTLKDDAYVTYHRSRYRGKRCYYLIHSAIEYIWTEVK